MGKGFKQTYQQRLVERRLAMLIVFVGVVLFGLKHWQETNRLNENSISSKDNDILGPQSDVKGGKLEVHDPMEDKTERPLGDSSSSDDNQNSIVDSANKKKRVAVATYIHKGNYDRAFSGYADGMLDNLAVMTSQVHRFAPEMHHDVQLLVFLDNTTRDMEPVFQRLGWHVRHLQVAVSYEDVTNKQISHELRTDGAIGIWEMLKLEAWRPSVVDLDVELIALIDTDIHIRKPFDAIFEPPFMAETSTLGFTQGAWVAEKVNGGFLVIRPDERSEADYHKIMELLKEGDFRSGSGWKGKTGWTYGGRTIQGLLPYYYIFGDGVGRGSNLSRCTFNNMVNSDICKQVPPTEVISNHFTGGCQKPWSCSGTSHALCKSFTDQWWSDVEYAEKWYGLQHRRRCPSGYESMGIKQNSVSIPKK